MDVLNDLIGKRVGNLIIKSYYKEKINGKTETFYICLCDCGNETKKFRRALTNKRTKNHSCGCMTKKFISESISKHGMSGTRFYNIWVNMKERVLNPKNTNYSKYGERGIGISEDWLRFERFRDDMYESYLKHSKDQGEIDTSIDRIDPDGNYEKDNCRWATDKQQGGNTRRQKKEFKAINLKTKEETIETNRAEFARRVGISDKNIGSVLNGNLKSTYGYTFKYID